MEDASADEREPDADEVKRFGPEVDVVLKAVLKSLSQVSSNTFRSNPLPVLYAGAQLTSANNCWQEALRDSLAAVYTEAECNTNINNQDGASMMVCGFIEDIAQQQRRGLIHRVLATTIEGETGSDSGQPSCQALAAGSARGASFCGTADGAPDETSLPPCLCGIS